MSRTNNPMTARLHELGQSLWLDNISRDLLDRGTLRRYIEELVDHRRNFQSDHIRRSHRRQWLRTTRAIRDGARAATVRRTAVHGAGARRPASRRRSAVPVFSASAGSMAGCPWRFRRHWSNDAARNHRSRGADIRQAARPNSSSRFQARTPVSRRSRNRYSTACRSTSRCCSRASNTSPRPRPICVVSSAGSAAGRDPRVASVASLFVSRWDRAVDWYRARRVAQPARHSHGRPRS